MSIVIPMNIQAIRVNSNDHSNIVNKFQGQTAHFQDMPYQGKNSYASTGDKVYTPLTTPRSQTPINPLGVGIHLHWELPKYFRKGVQDSGQHKLVFPHAPNRWLVTRYLSVYDLNNKTYEEVTSKSWVVESDYLSDKLLQEANKPTRPMVSVPLNPKSADKISQPYMFMGRVIDYDQWGGPTPKDHPDYLPAYGTDTNPLYLTSMGFVGAYFSSYYPECNSVFGFWDTFDDLPGIYSSIKENTPLQFKATYQVVGWINDEEFDPLYNLNQTVRENYQEYLARCQSERVSPKLTPSDFASDILSKQMKWQFNRENIKYELNEDNSIKSLNIPSASFCSGVIQEIVWNMGENSSTTYFLANPETTQGNDTSATWETEGKVSIGNSTIEAVSARLKADLGQTTKDSSLLKDYEYLLDALQLGVLKDFENTPQILNTLEEKLHTSAFSTHDGGKVWELKPKADQSNPGTIPLELSRKLAALNQAQQSYDMGRQGLLLKRKQLFMDWIRYVKIYTDETSNENNEFGFDTNNLISFLLTSSSGELPEVQNEEKSLGMLSYSTNKSDGIITGITNEPDNSTQAYTVWQSYQDMINAIRQNNLTLVCMQAPPFHMPSDPVLLVESDALDPSLRKTNVDKPFVRFTSELLSQINIQYQSNTLTVSSDTIKEIPKVKEQTPNQVDLQTIVSEVFFTTPMLAPTVITALMSKNPSFTQQKEATKNLISAQGGLSPLESTQSTSMDPATLPSNLYQSVHEPKYVPTQNTTIAVNTPLDVQFTFTNKKNNGWLGDGIGWTAQELYPNLSSSRYDPFLPLFIIWKVSLNPLCKGHQDSTKLPAYSDTNITEYFELDDNSVDYQYLMNGNQAVEFTDSTSSSYSYFTTLNSNAGKTLMHQIKSYQAHNQSTPDKESLENIIDSLKGKTYISQNLGYFNAQQILTSPIAKVPVDDLILGKRDTVTTAIKQGATPDWYKFGFNSLQPMATGLPAESNFGPLRSGFLSVNAIEIVDVFGQRMQLKVPDGKDVLNCMPSYELSPNPNDKANSCKAFLPPRILTPTRLNFNFISSSFDSNSGECSDFVDLLPQPTTSPILGWIVPNHLDNALFFYDSNGAAIGAFDIEHVKTNPTLVYRTRPGNEGNPSNDVSLDIGTEIHPIINPHLANFMRYINGRDAHFLIDLMGSIQNSLKFINPANFAESAALSVLVGRPLALVRAQIGIQTAGNLLPISQANCAIGNLTVKESPFAQDVLNKRYQYTERMKYSSASLGDVRFPVHLGDLHNMNDGIIGYVIENSNQNPYVGNTFYSPAATTTMKNGISLPSLQTLQVSLNSQPQSITMLVDPCAQIHATTGILPIKNLQIPKGIYTAALQNIDISFKARPLLKGKDSFDIPLPKENGFDWEFIMEGKGSIAMKPNNITETPKFGYSPQEIVEGWVSLKPKKLN